MPLDHPRRRFVAALSLASAAPWSAAAAEADLRRAWPRGRPTPALALPSYQGPPWRLADARGKVVLLNFWASWCEPCVTELPTLELLAARHERDGLEVLAVNFRETDAAVRRFTQRMPTTLPILRDTDGGAARDWGVRIFPTSIVIGRDGRAAFSVVGEVDWGGETARSWIRALL
jgi:thiol-disulfide isomerase/thioredoxin